MLAYLPAPRPASFTALVYGGILVARGIYTFYQPAFMAGRFRVPLGPAPPASATTGAGKPPHAAAYDAAIAFTKVQGAWYIGYGAMLVTFAAHGDRFALGVTAALGALAFALNVPVVVQHGVPRGWFQHAAAAVQFGVIGAVLLW